MLGARYLFEETCRRLSRLENAMNSIFVIKPYKWESMWVFDDANVGLVKEPFVGGADTMIRSSPSLPAERIQISGWPRDRR